MHLLMHRYGRRGDHSPRLRFRTGRATFAASWLLSQKALYGYQLAHASWLGTYRFTAIATRS